MGGKIFGRSNDEEEYTQEAIIGGEKLYKVPEN